MTMITPLLDAQITTMDNARMQFINELTTYIDKLREELRVNEIILHSVVKSVSNQSEQTAILDNRLHQDRSDLTRHKPSITNLTDEEQKLLRAMEDPMTQYKVTA